MADEYYLFQNDHSYMYNLLATSKAPKKILAYAVQFRKDNPKSKLILARGREI